MTVPPRSVINFRRFIGSPRGRPGGPEIVRYRLRPIGAQLRHALDGPINQILTIYFASHGFNI